MSKSTKVIKYKIVNTNVDKKFIGKNLDLQEIKSKGDSRDGGRKPGTKNKMTLGKLAKIVIDGFTGQAKFNKTIFNRIDNLVKVNNLKE